MQMLLALLAALPTAVTALQPLNGIGVKPLGGAASIDVGALLDKKAAVVFGTYAADFNAIEYGQRLRHYAPKLKERGVESLHLILNADEAASQKFVELLGLEGVCEVYCDPTGAAGRAAAGRRFGKFRAPRRRRRASAAGRAIDATFQFDRRGGIPRIS